jgi:hypothetical protein
MIMSGSNNTFGLLIDKITAIVFLLLILISCAEIFDLPEITMAPRITSIEPEEGPEGTIVTITGLQFSPDSEMNKVRFNGKIAIITESTVNTIKAIVPEDAGTGPVEVVVDNKATQGPEFKFLYYPAIFTLDPLEGKPGAEVVLTGKYFAQEPDDNLVQFGGRTATVLSTDSTTQLTVSLPADAQSGEVTVTVNGLTGVGPFFTVLPTEQPVHSITGIEPTSGKPGTVVSITGVNFSPIAANNLVKFKDTPADIISASPEKLEVYAPEVGISGIVSVTIAGLIANGPVFTYVMDPPVISQYVPDFGYAGDTIQIIGENFSQIPTENLVKFNGKDAKVLESTGLILKVIVPEDAGKGPVSITVGGQTGTGPEFNYLDNTPFINDFNPKSGPVGTTVVIQGGNFGSDPTAITVQFNGISTPVKHLAGGSSITVEVPETATSGMIIITIGDKTTKSSSEFMVTVPDDKGTWKATASMNKNRHGHTATLLQDGRVLVTGGNTDGFTDCEIYDPVAGTWTQTGALLHGRYFHEAVLLNDGKVLVAGGLGFSSLECELFDPSTGTWSYTTSYNYSRVGLKLTSLANGDVLGIGSGGSRTNQMEVYKPQTETWELTAEMPEPNLVVRTATLLESGKVLVAGGRGGTTLDFNSLLYDPIQNNWSSTSGAMIEKRSSATANLLPNGEVLIAGGISPANPRLKSAEIFDPITETYRPTGDLNIERFQHRAVRLPDNKILVIGGTDLLVGQGRSCEVYDPTSGIWNTIPNTIHSTRDFTATLLANGQVLITGGSLSLTVYSNLCELYTP